MSHTTFEHSVQDANIWLKGMMETLHFGEKRHAYSALRATLHALRDRLPPDGAVHFGAQLPMLIRGLYYEGWRIAGKPVEIHTADAFADYVARELPQQFPMDPQAVARRTFAFLEGHMDAGEVRKVIGQLPQPIKALWPQFETAL